MQHATVVPDNDVTDLPRLPNHVFVARGIGPEFIEQSPDIWFEDISLQSEYERVTEELYSAVSDGISTAVNSFDPEETNGIQPNLAADGEDAAAEG